MLIKHYNIQKNERALLFCNGDFQRVLTPGKHRVWHGFKPCHVERFDITNTTFKHALSDYFFAKEPALLEAEFLPVTLNSHQVGLHYENNRLMGVLPPGTRQLFWKGLQDVRVDVVDIQEQYRIEPKLVRVLMQKAQGFAGTAKFSDAYWELYEVPEFHVGVLMVDGKMEDMLPPGKYGFWLLQRNVRMQYVDLRAQHLEVSGQEILTKDKVSLRINLAAVWRYDDVQEAFAQQPRPDEHVYRMLQFGLRAAVGTRTLDALLENKDVLEQAVMQYARAQLAKASITLESIGIKDIILSGDMKTILAQVVEAEKAAQANVIRRREETAATRSLLNTAKVMQDNPVALRMKELETLERVADRIDRISVVGGLDQVLNGLVTLKQTH